MKCILLTGGKIDDYKYIKSIIAAYGNADVLICADSGASHLEKLGYMPCPDQPSPVQPPGLDQPGLDQPSPDLPSSPDQPGLNRPSPDQPPSPDRSGLDRPSPNQPPGPNQPGLDLPSGPEHPGFDQPGPNQPPGSDRPEPGSHYDQIAHRLIVGDMDSVDPQLLESCYASGFDALHFPAAKDFTDTELAAEEAINMGCVSILILGALGGRCDHSHANTMLLMKLAHKNIRAVIADEKNLVTAITNRMEIHKSDILSSFFGFPASGTAKPHSNTRNLSLFPLGGEARGVTTTGLAYPLVNFTMPPDYTSGVSNFIMHSKASISIISGCLLVITSHN